MDSELKHKIFEYTQATKILRKECIQELWSGYGEILRVELDSDQYPSIIVKKIQPPKHVNHPRGWNTNASFERKLRSYEIEQEWYETYSAQCTNKVRIPEYFFSLKNDSTTYIVMEDLNSSGFPKRYNGNSIEVAKLCIQWLAKFHAVFMIQKPIGLWEVGTYWHLETRKDEFEVMAEGALKQNANKIDEVLTTCEFQTFVHGDAKLANFCFSENLNSVAAVDFQYVGGGCGMKDLAYFLGSCLNDHQLKEFEDDCLNYYFSELEKALALEESNLEFNALEKEWRQLYPIAWADFSRFLEGWMPGHRKLNDYAASKTKEALIRINEYEDFK